MKFTEHFTVRADDGTTYAAVTVLEVIESRPLDGGVEEMLAMKEYLLADGRHLNRIDDNTFEIVATGQHVTRVR